MHSFNVALFSEEEKAVYNAVVKGDLERLKLLLEGREDKNPVVSVSDLGSGFSVLGSAAYYGHVNIIKWYQETLHFDDINPLNSVGTYTPMMFAAQQGQLNVVKYYIEALQGE